MTASTEDLAWLVSRRNEIQSLLLELHGRRERSGISPERSGHWQLLVGVAFSLWRAVFLLVDTPHRRHGSELEAAAADFLLGVVKTNAVGFPDDRKAHLWTGAYYVNNARLRMAELSSDLGLADGGSRTTIPFDEDVRASWDALLHAARSALDAVLPPERGEP